MRGRYVDYNAFIVKGTLKISLKIYLCEKEIVLDSLRNVFSHLKTLEETPHQY